MVQVIKGKTQSLQWLSDLLSFFQTEAIKIPDKYRDKVLETKKLLKNDTSGLINTVLDFAIDCALVDYTIKTDNDNLTDVLNEWLLNLNTTFRGKLPTGLRALAKEYFRERWKGSSHLLLRTFWEKKDDLELPHTMFFLEGEDIIVKSSKTAREGKIAGGTEEVVILGDEIYYIRII